MTTPAPDFDALRALAAQNGIMRDDRGRVLDVPLDASDAEILDGLARADEAEARALAERRALGISNGTGPGWSGETHVAY